MKISELCAVIRLLTNPYSKKRYIKVHKKVKQLCLHLPNGVQGRSPCKKKRCHSEAASADRHAAEESRAAPIYKRGAVPVRSGLMCIIVKLKSNVVVRTFKRQNNTKSLCNFDTTQ